MAENLSLNFPGMQLKKPINMKDPKEELPRMPNEFDPLGAISGYGATKTEINVLNKISELLDSLSKQTFTYKKVSEDPKSYDYEVYYKGELYGRYGAPVEKVIVMLVDALEKGYNEGAKFIMTELIDHIHTDHNGSK